MSQGEAPTEARRVQSFARYFERYMNGLGLIVALLPLPVTGFDLLPTFYFQTGPLAVGTTFFGLLLSGIIFYYRHPLAHLMFAKYLEGAANEDTPSAERENAAAFRGFWINLAPPLLFVTAIACFFIYLAVFNYAVNNINFFEMPPEAQRDEYISREEALNQAETDAVPQQPWLALLHRYVSHSRSGIFADGAQRISTGCTKHYRAPAHLSPLSW